VITEKVNNKATVLFGMWTPVSARKHVLHRVSKKRPTFGLL